MSEREQKIRKQIAELEEEYKLLEILQYYYKENKSFVEIERQFKIKIRTLRQYMSENDFPTKAYMDGSTLNKVQERIERITGEEIPSLKEELTGSLKSITFFNDWMDFIEAQSLGYYANQPVTEIYESKIVILADLVYPCTEQLTGDALIVMAGPGIYYTKFAIGKGTIVVDHKELNGIVLPMHLYEKAMNADSVFDSDISDIQMTKWYTNIPFSLILSPDSVKVYLRGIISRNLLHPNREIFDLFYQTCSDSESFKEEEGLKILSAGFGGIYYNTILTEKENLPNYNKLIPGIRIIQAHLPRVLEDLQINIYREEIFQTTQTLKKEFAETGYKLLKKWK
ncbi:MAG: hypothetical protein ACFFC7_22785 [Candidatus Hermodarchaeota archaeon]